MSSLVRHSTGSLLWTSFLLGKRRCACAASARVGKRCWQSLTSYVRGKKPRAGVGSAKCSAPPQELTGNQTRASQGIRAALMVYGRLCGIAAAIRTGRTITGTEVEVSPCADVGPSLRTSWQIWGSPPKGLRLIVSTTTRDTPPTTAAGRPVNSRRTTRLPCYT